MATFANRFAHQSTAAALAAARISAASVSAVTSDAIREAARLASYTTPTNVLTAEDAGADAKIVIAAHDRIYPVQGDIDIPDLAIAAAELPGLAFGTQYSIYYDDVTLADPTPVFVAVESATGHADAQVGAALGRHFVGVVSTPADGGASSGGTGGYPGGGGGGLQLD